MSLGQYQQNTVAAEISKYMGNAVSLSNIWGSIIYNVKASPYLAKGDGITDDTAAIQAAVNAAQTAGAGIIWIPSGSTFLIDTVNLTSNLIVTGGGTLKFKNNTAAFALLELNASNNVIIDEIIFDGNVTNQTTWNESRHTIQIIDSDSVTVKNCRFINLIGDGIYINNSSTNVTIDKNRFIGNNTNRNGVSVINASGVDIINNTFYQMARNDMPGAIDLEPNTTTDSITNVNIKGNRFIGGATASLQKAVSVNDGANGTITEINIEGNLIRGCFFYGIAVFGGTAPSTPDVSIKNNRIRDTYANLTEGCGIIISTNVNADIQNNMIINTNDHGIKTVGATFTIIGNTIKLAKKFGIYQLATTDNGKISDNHIIDCGTNATSQYGGIQTNASFLDITNNRIISSSTTLSQLGLYVAAGTMNYIANNTFKGMGVRSMTIATNPNIIGQNKYDGSSGFISLGGTYPPTSGTFQAGQIIYNPNPAVSGTSGSQYIVLGWICTVAGTPGTWQPLRCLTGT
jgi:hypothetical protein